MQDLQAGDRIVTLHELFDSYMRNHARQHCKRWDVLERMWNSYLKQDWALRDVQTVTRFDMQQLHAHLAESAGRTTANRVIQMLRAVYNRGREWELTDRNPCVGVRLFKLTKRARFLDIEELVRWIDAVEKLRYRTTRDFLWVCLLTAARRSNVAAMRWEHVSLDRAIWYLPAEQSKNGVEQYIPLTAMAIDILYRRKKAASSPWVFPSTRSPSGHLTKPEKAWSVVMRTAGLTDVRIHDLRRTLASWQAITGATLPIIAQTLNHQDIKSTMIYAHLQVEPVREAMETAQSRMFRNLPKPAW